jgi:hypothetical protein
MEKQQQKELWHEVQLLEFKKRDLESRINRILAVVSPENQVEFKQEMIDAAKKKP